MSERKETEVDKKTLGLIMLGLGISTGLSLGLTLGWMFAPIGFAFLVLGIVFVTQARKGE